MKLKYPAIDCKRYISRIKSQIFFGLMMVFFFISPSFASVEVSYLTDDVNTTKQVNPYVTNIVSHSYATLIFPTEGPLTVGTTFQVVIVNGESGAMLNEVRFATSLPPLSQISALNIGA